MRQRKVLVLFVLAVFAMSLLTACFLFDENLPEEEKTLPPANNLNEEAESPAEDLPEEEKQGPDQARLDDQEKKEEDQAGADISKPQKESVAEAQPVKKETEAETGENVIAEPQKETREAIVGKYAAEFDALKSAAESSIEDLIKKAYNEYHSVEEDERTVGFKLKLANKYMKAGNGLEESFDLKFYGILSRMEAELTLLEYDTNILKEIEKNYKAEKSARRKALISKAMDKI